MARATVFTTRDQGEWEAALPSHVSVFGSVQYATICEEQTGCQARLFVFESHESTVAYPFFLRPISSLPFAVELPWARSDIRSPEFTGPIASRPPSPSTASAFAEQFARYCQREGIVAEFAHLHPWDAQPACLVSPNVETDREIVYVDLRLSEEQIWQDSLTYACRKNLKRARQAGLRVYEASTPADIQEFFRIYTQTMDRNGALGRYYYPLGFFMAFFACMPDNARFVLAEYEGQTVAAILYMHDGASVYSYLGGADYAFQQVRPTNAVVYETIAWARSRGKKRLVLGGGYRRDDGIFRFKASFSPLRAHFRVYRRVHLPETYGALCRAWSHHYGQPLQPDGYFPAYRFAPEQERSKAG